MDPSTPTFQFHPFPHLPPEIRLRIWSLALCGPRTLTVSCKRGIHPTLRRYARSFSSPTPPPSLLSVNHEARIEALRVYSAHFRTEYAPSCLYVAFDRDVLRLPEDALMYVARDELALIQRLVIDVVDTGYFGDFNIETVQCMTRLVELTLILADMPMDPARGTGQRYLDALCADFHEAVEKCPAWRCPRVILLGREGEEMGVITGEKEGDV